MVTTQKKLTPAARKAAILGRMSRMDETVPDRNVVAQLYSVPGAGKSTLIAELAQALRGDRQVLYVDARQGWISLEDKPELKEETIYSGSYYPAKDLMALADMLLDDRENDGPTSGVGVLVLDEYTTWYKDVLEDSVRGRTGIDGVELLPAVEGLDHGPAAAIMEAVLAKLVSVPDLDVLIVAHAREKAERVRGAGEARTTYMPNYPPLMRINIEALLHSSVFLQRKIDGRGKATRTVITAPSSTVQAKNRFSTMPIGEITPKQYVQAIVAWKNGEGVQHAALADLGETPEEEGA